MKKVKSKTSHVMIPSKRTSLKDSPTSNRIKATLGDKEGNPAVLLFGFLKQLSSRPNPALSLVFAEEMGQILKSGDGAILRSLADLIETQVARPALEAAWSMREYWTPCMEAGFPPPQVKKKEIISRIMARSGCNERTAEKAATEAGLAKVYGWKAGRPRNED